MFGITVKIEKVNNGYLVECSGLGVNGREFYPTLKEVFEFTEEAFRTFSGGQLSEEKAQ